MFKNYVKTAIRNLSRNKGFTAINIFGLALGMATCLLITLFVQNELSYDRYNKKASQIVRVTFKGVMESGVIKESNVMPPLAAAFKKDFPEVLEATRIRANGTHKATVGLKSFKNESLAFVDSNFFRVFTLPLIKGSEATALVKPFTVVISAEGAKRYFGDENPVGKVLVMPDDNASLTVTGVFDKIPETSHFHFDLLASMASMPEAREQSWMISSYYTYLLLPQGYNYKQLEAKLPQEIDRYIGPQLEKGMGTTLAEFRKKGNSLGFNLQPITDIHLKSDLTGDMEPYGNIQYVYIFSAVAVFMLLIACINFMNLSTAGASKRAREVGIRKVLGSLKTQLVKQFLLESLLLAAIAMVIALAMVYWALPLLNNLAGKNLTLSLFSNPWVLPGLLTFGVITGFLAGSYPAFFLSSFNPIAVLKGRFSTGKKTVSLRSGLVVFQFFISVGLIIGTLVVYSQLKYIHNINLGYDKSQVVVIENTWALGKNGDVLKQQLLQDRRVVNVTSSGYLPAGNSYGNNYFVYPDNQTKDIAQTLRYEVDDNYIPTLGMKMAAGRNFSKAYGADSTAVIINETAARAFGWKNNFEQHTLSHTDNDGKKYVYRVIGVVKDFNFRSLHQLITPLVMTMTPGFGETIVKINTADVPGVLASMKSKWGMFKTEQPFTYSFLDDRYNNTYKAEQNIGAILGIFAGLTIFVACLGLFGLATFTAEQRTKEIGIRKVLGADVKGLVSLLSKDFLKLVLIAFAIASPAAWYVMHWWLQGFAYRINISWLIFATAGTAVVIITLITVSYQSVKAALMNPVKSLKTE